MVSSVLYAPLLEYIKHTNYSLVPLSLPVSIKQSSYDILWAIQGLKKDAPIQLIPKHVKGHQDQLGRKLSLQESLNCDTDIKAGEYRK